MSFASSPPSLNALLLVSILIVIYSIHFGLQNSWEVVFVNSNILLHQQTGDPVNIHPSAKTPLQNPYLLFDIAFYCSDGDFYHLEVKV